MLCCRPDGGTARFVITLLLTLPTLAWAQNPEDTPAPATASAQAPVRSEARLAVSDLEQGSVFDNLRRTTGTFTLVSETRGLSFHRPLYLMPITWSPQYSSENSEVLFQISLKQRLFNRNFFFAYNQKSFWQLYDGNNSRPFRETNYSPEFFYRWKPEFASVPGLGFDAGFDHESNGRELPASRSWNRIVGAVYHESPTQLVHLKLWYRIPEDKNRAEDDPKRDDNPDIYKYYGYGELRLQQMLFGNSRHLASLMLRGNPATGKGAVELIYSVPFADYAYWNVYVWHGYGESLADYNDSTTRVGVGFMLAR